MEGSDLEETSGSSRMGSASRVPPGDSSRNIYEQGRLSSSSLLMKSLCNTHEKESQLPSPSRHPAEIARGDVILDHYGGRLNVQQFSSLQHDEVKHKIFISHSGAQKDFAEQLCLDLERRGFIFPFFDQRHHSLPKGKDFVALIKEAARHCLVAVILLSEDFLCSKWPMIELAEFHGAQQAGNQRLIMLPLFYKLSAKDLDERAIEERWMPTWRQLASVDERIDVDKWSAALRALRKVNGLVFGQEGASEVAYRKDIVQSIFRLSPSNLLYGSSCKMVGFNRICQTVCDRFVRGTSGGPSYLGLYGTIGAGKTTLSKALCDHFYGEYMGRVCHVDLGETPRMGKVGRMDFNAKSPLWRVKRMLERLCGLEKEALDRITDFDEGLMLIRMHLKREPVFLVIDNVTDENNWKEAHQYLMAGFHPESRVVITSRSISNIGGLVPGIQFCMPMPRLNVTEAGELFLRSAVPEKSIFGLSAEERRIVGLCIQECSFFEVELCDSGEDEKGNSLLEKHVHKAWGMRYHPVALSALGDFFRRYFSNGDMLCWTDYLEENKDPLWDLWKSSNGIGGIIGLQFHSLHPSERLLFLDVATLIDDDECPGVYFDSLNDGNDSRIWLCKVHDKTESDMERQLQDLERSGIITYYDEEENMPCFSMHDIYRKYAKWYVTNHGVKQLKNAWCVFDTPRSMLDQKYVASDLVRLRMFNLDRASVRLLASKMMQELHELEVLQLGSCPYLTELNLEGLESLKHLELWDLPNLVAVTLKETGDTADCAGIFESLQFVLLFNLDSLVHGPDVKSCTSLYGCHVYGCQSMTNLDGLECPTLKVLEIRKLPVHPLARLPNVKTLHSLEVFIFNIDCDVAMCDVEASRKLKLRDLGKPYMKVVEEFLIYLCTKPVVSGMRLSIIWRKRNPLFESLVLVDSRGDKYEWR